MHFVLGADVALIVPSFVTGRLEQMVLCHLAYPEFPLVCEILESAWISMLSFQGAWMLV